MAKKGGHKNPGIGRPPPLIRAMPERKHFFSIDAFPMCRHYHHQQETMVKNGMEDMRSLHFKIANKQKYELKMNSVQPPQLSRANSVRKPSDQVKNPNPEMKRKNSKGMKRIFLNLSCSETLGRSAIPGKTH